MDNGASSYRRFLSGDDTGLFEIVRDYKDGLTLFLNRYVKDLQVAEDLTEDTFFRLITRKPRFTEQSSFKTWLYTIGRNLALNHLKRSRRISITPIEDLSLEAESIEQAYLRNEENLRLYRALSCLKADYAAVLQLKYFEELSNAEIARVMKKNKRQVENLLYQAKQALKTELEGFPHERL